MSEHFDIYMKAVGQALAQGQATEHTYRPALKALLEAHAPGVTATNEPKRAACGAPDFVIETGKAHNRLIVGYAETKDLGADLNEIERSEQLLRYRAALPNLLLTNYMEFRWYVDGERRLTATLASVGGKAKLQSETNGVYEVGVLLDAFLTSEPLTIGKAKDLALRMARLAHLIRDVIIKAFEEKHASQTLTDLRQAFAKTLIPDLMEPGKTAEFADMYAQTIAYGLFAARCFDKTPENFTRDEARHLIPKTNPFLRKLFDMISGTEMDDEPYAGFVDDLVQLLGRARMDQVLTDFGRRTARQDPVVHFYETFLAAYDPALRKARGVYYTPEPVVSYIVRSVDHLLKTRFDCPGGLSDTQGTTYSKKDETGHGFTTPTPRVLLLDPACGTGTFLYAVVDHIRSQFMREGNAGLWSGYVKNHLLPRLFGFELLMAPYSVAHFKLGMALAGLDLPEAQRKEWAYDFATDERLGIFLTNTLEEAAKRSETLFGPLRAITEEADAAALVKRQLPIMIVMGNPPYAGHSANASVREAKRINKFGKWVTRKEETFIGGLLKDYYKVDGKPLGEKNPKWLQDDYVKFLRFGQWRIEQTGSGILAFITNHGYLDNPTFRGMRQSLMATFDDIYLLDLHGNSKKKEKAPDGGPDKNVFDIQQGVAIALMVKYPPKA